MASNRADGDTDYNVSESKSDALTDMSEEEMAQHLELCLKLDAENKINKENAFKLHLIDIMHHKIKHSTPDLQSASMSLQASSKIYASRVDALYKETMQFHNQLQTVLNKEVVEGRDHDIDGEDDNVDEEPKEKRRITKTKKSYITTEDKVTLKPGATYQNKMPHANYIAIKSAFCASWTAPKLLERLLVENDSSKLACATALPCFSPVAPVPVVNFPYPAKLKGLIEKIKNFRPDYEESLSGTFCSDVFYPPSSRSSVGAPDMDPPSDDSFVIASPPVQEPQDADVDEIIDKFSVLDITADMLVKDLSHAIVDENTIDRNRLPPNSVLRRVLNSAEKSKRGKIPLKVKKEKAPRKPFFNQERVVDESDKSILKKTRRIELTDKAIDKWKLNDTTTGSDGIELFSTLSSDNINTNRTISNSLQNSMLENTPQYFDGYFCKEFQPWNKYGKQRSAHLIRPSSFGACMNNNQSEEISENSNLVVQSFQNLSLQNSPANSSARSDDYDPGINMAPPDVGNMAFVNTISNQPSTSSCLFDDDLKSVLVTPPEVSQPIIPRFETQPITLSTGKVKNAIWNIVEQAEETMLSELHKKLQKVFHGEFLPLQYVFASLLMLANEKCLLLENDSERDIKITKDIPE